jgi:hypothetical protein
LTRSELAPASAGTLEPKYESADSTLAQQDPTPEFVGATSSLVKKSVSVSKSPLLG